MKSPDRHRSYCPLPAAVVVTLLLAACGQYGDLYLPEEAPAPEKTQAQPAPEKTPQQVEEEDQQDELQLEQQEVTQPEPL